MNHLGKSVVRNQLELLIFTLGDAQLYGINVHKVREVGLLPRIHEVPKSHPYLLGVVDFRNETVPVIDLNKALNKAVHLELGSDMRIIYISINNEIQSFVVDLADRIVRVDWDQVKSPPLSRSLDNCLTSVTRIDGQLVEIVDIEKIIDDVSEPNVLSQKITKVDQLDAGLTLHKRVLVIDDSALARQKTVQVLSSLGIETLTSANGIEGLSVLKDIAAEACKAGRRIEDDILMVITDLEMPLLDGVAFIETVRRDSDLKNLYIVIQSSIAKSSADSIVESERRVDGQIVKWNQEKLVQIILNRIEGVVK